jgi:hypothetical protein
MTARGLLIVLALALQAEPSTALARHCYAVWRYPWPQRCGVLVASRLATVRSPEPVTPVTPEKLLKFGSGREKAAIELPPKPHPVILLPVLGPVEAVEAAGETRARLMLRAALGDPHAD